MWNDKFELLDGSYSVSNIEYYFKYITNKYEAVTDNPPVQLHVNNRKKGLHLKLKEGIVSNFKCLKQ